MKTPKNEEWVRIDNDTIHDEKQGKKNSILIVDSPTLVLRMRTSTLKKRMKLVQKRM